MAMIYTPSAVSFVFFLFFEVTSVIRAAVIHLQVEPTSVYVYNQTIDVFLLLCDAILFHSRFLDSASHHIGQNFPRNIGQRITYASHMQRDWMVV